MSEGKHRILYALYSRTWAFNLLDTDSLERNAQEVAPSEFTSEMKSHIYCPLCFTPLSRVPSLVNISSSGITAHFRHKDKEKYPRSQTCKWRTEAKPGLYYANEEEVKKAVENEELAIISKFESSPPSTDDDLDDNGEFNQHVIEDRDGEKTEVPIGRHTGETCLVMGKFSTIMGLCREFPKNLKKGFFLPDQQIPMLLSDLLHSTRLLDEDSSDNPRLYFGRIIEFQKLNARNAITVQSNDSFPLKLYTKFDFDRRKHISEASVGRVIIFYKQLFWSYEYKAKNLEWGEYSLLPQKYETLLPQSSES